MLKLILVLIVFCIVISDACKFVEQPKEVRYCKAKFAGIITVATNGYPCELNHLKRCYGINCVQQTKGTLPPSIAPVVLETALDSAGCGVELTPGNTYFIASDLIDSHVVSLYTSQLNEDWTELSPSERKTKVQDYQATNCTAGSTRDSIKTLPATGPLEPVSSVE